MNAVKGTAAAAPTAAFLRNERRSMTPPGCGAILPARSARRLWQPVRGFPGLSGWRPWLAGPRSKSAGRLYQVVYGSINSSYRGARAYQRRLRDRDQMTTYIALLRAVNLGPHNKVGMSDLRGLTTALG